MNATHWHLLLNHVPILGAFFGLALLVAGAFSRDGRLWLTRAALATFIAVGVMAVPANVTGEEAEHQVEHLPGVTHRLIHEHEEAAEAALVAAGLLGATALATLLLQPRNPVLASRVLWSVWILAIVTAGLMARTGYEGGKIRRPEMRDEPSQTPAR